MPLAHARVCYLPAGVVSGVLDEAQEQEDNEAMLAYFFLWSAVGRDACTHSAAAVAGASLAIICCVLQTSHPHASAPVGVVSEILPP